MEKTGILDPGGLNLNPLNNEPFSDNYKELAKKWSKFPAYEKASEIIDIIKSNQVILVISGTGSGKTVLLPKYTLHALDYKGHIGITLPKQIIAKSAAEFAATTLDVKLGEQIGYQYKGSDASLKGRNPNLLYATDGTIVARLLNDPELKEFDAIIIDEAHERKIQIDFLLYLLRNVIRKRKEFKLIIMSATINAEIFSSYFATEKFITIDIGGKTNFPIESIFSDEKANSERYIERGMKIIDKLMKEYSADKLTKINDILFFVTSINETIEVRDKLLTLYPTTTCIAVYAGMDTRLQDKVQTKETNDRRILISTNVAESSLTVDGIKYVIDSGFELFSYDEPEKHAKVLEKKLITQAQAKQRMGRAGRTESGICYHLYMEDEFLNLMKKFPEPSIRTSDITNESLKLMSQSENKDINGLLTILSQLIEPPREIYIRTAIKNMELLKVLEFDKKSNSSKLNKLGLLLSSLNLELQSGLSLILAYKLKCFREVLTIIVGIETIKGNLNDFFRVPSIEEESKQKFLFNKFKEAKDKISHKYGDFMTVYKIVNKYNEKLEMDNEEKIKEFIYDYFLDKEKLNKINANFKRVFYRIKDGLRESNETILEIFPQEIDYSISLESKIIASLLYGFRINTLSKKGDLYKTFFEQTVNITKESTLFNTNHRSLFYYELFIMSGKSDAKIVSLIPASSAKIVEEII
jgi:pre-mRNA-splicing factor ATP-dependent RNA helicase DHX15/PRP43